MAETVYGLIRMDRRIDAIADELKGGASLAPLARDELKLPIYEAQSGVPPAALAPAAERLVRGGIDSAGAGDAERGSGRRSGLEREAVRLSYPTWLLETFGDDLGQSEALALAEAMNRRAPLAIRVNTARVTRDKLAATLAEEHVVAAPTPLSPVGLTFETRVNAFGLSAFRDGLYEVMDEGSQLVAELVAPPPGGRVLDACAGAGGKTLALGALMGGKGRVLAIDTDGKKLEELRRRARRAGLTNVEAKVVSDDPCVDRGGRPRKLRPRPGRRPLLGWDAAPNPEARWRLTRAAVWVVPAASAGADGHRRAAGGGRRPAD